MRTSSSSRPMSRLLLKRVFQIVLGICLFLGIWQLAVSGLRIPKYLVPLPLDVLRAARQNWTVIAGQASFTLTAATLGLAASTVFAVGVALCFSVSRNLAQMSLPLLMILRSMPVAAVAPIMMLILGRGIATSSGCRHHRVVLSAAGEFGARPGECGPQRARTAVRLRRVSLANPSNGEIAVRSSVSLCGFACRWRKRDSGGNAFRMDHGIKRSRQPDFGIR